MQNSFEQIGSTNHPITTYPWIQKVQGQLEIAIKTNRFPQSIIISGPKNIGLEELFDSLAKGVICRTGSWGPCNSCNNCSLTINSSHPDMFWLGDEDKEKEVNIENIRNATEFLSSKPIISKRKLLSINLNHGFSYNAISAILKILEEPPDNSYLIIRIDNLGRLPKTIISRCQILDVAQPTCEMVKKWYESQFLKQINDQGINGFCSASYFLATHRNDRDGELYRVGNIMTSFLWNLCHKSGDFDSFPEKLNDYNCEAILGGVELTIYLIILTQYQQKPSKIFVDKRKTKELETLGQKIETEKLLNLLGHIAYLKRLCFNTHGVKASDISDLIFSNTIKEIL